MPPTESSILSNFLLSAATLSSAVTNEEFADLFPDTKKDSPEVGQLYRELQHQRAIDADDVQHNIELEVRRGDKMKRDIMRTRKAESQGHKMDGFDARDTAMELFGDRSDLPQAKPHSIRTIQHAIANACKELEVEIAEMEAEAGSLLGNARSTIDDLSALGYRGFDGSSSTPNTDNLNQEALESLIRLQEVCRDIDNGAQAYGETSKNSSAG
ncbi:MAG: hypothetical protein Q9157_000032 [Trypethelium eluteriae]